MKTDREIRELLSKVKWHVYCILSEDFQHSSEADSHIKRQCEKFIVEVSVDNDIRLAVAALSESH